MQSATRSRSRDVEPLWKRVLEENIYFLQENLMLTDSIFAYLIQEKILTMEMVDKIKTSSVSDQGRTMELVRCLKKRSDDCFDKFLDVLHATENTFVADQLEQSMQPSRQSYSSDETELLLQTKDRQIRELEERLAAKDRRIRELESVNEKLKIRMDESLRLWREEMRISDHYRNSTSVFYDEQRSVDELEKEVDEKDVQLRESEDKVEELQLRIESLEEELESVKEDLRTREDQIKVVLEKDRRIKRKLGLDENASEHEIMEQLQRNFHSRADMKRAQDELVGVRREKMSLDDRIATIMHEKDRLHFEIRQKEIELEQLRRRSLGNSVPKPKRQYTYNRKQVGPLLERVKTIPIIDVNRYPQLPDSVGIKPSIPIRPKMSNVSTARVSSAAVHETQLPLLRRGKTFANFEERETKYCVICRMNYYLKNECRIHVEPIRGGKFTCCGADINSKYVGCKLVKHMYIYFTGVGNEYVFYDERGRQLDFKDQ